MSLKDKVKRSKFLSNVYRKFSACRYALATIISPKLNVSLRYKKVFRKKINLKNPKTLEEKLQWLKIYNYNKNPLVIQCADKYAVRDYVKSCGYGYILNNLLGVYNDVKEIPWGDLPSKFVLKWNFGAGMNIVCKNKEKLNKSESERKLRKWKKNKCWLSNAEMQYKYAPKKILCEEFLIDETQLNGLTDYKVYCFHGEPKAILVMHDRETGIKTEFFNTQWEKLENTDKYNAPLSETEKPKSLNEMLACARKLTKPFPFVRCDFYIVNEKLYFGEMTFTPAGGLYLSKTSIEGKDMTEFLKVNNK